MNPSKHQQQYSSVPHHATLLEVFDSIVLHPGRYVFVKSERLSLGGRKVGQPHSTLTLKMYA
jgi:hypothetical protein